MKTSKETYFELNIMKSYGVFVVLSLGFICTTNAQCVENRSLTFIRVSGVTPDTPTPVFVYSAGRNEESLVGACLKLCKELDECVGVVVTYGKGFCQGIASKPKQNFKLDNDGAYFKKICLSLPKNCSKRWWAIETTPGYHFHSDTTSPKILPNTTIFECYETLFGKGNDKKYRSAQWFMPLTLFNADMIKLSYYSMGNCVLNVENRITEPQSYRVSNYYTFYIENQCQHDYTEKIERCSYEEYYDQTLKHVERTVQNYTKFECKTACELSEQFICRGFTWISDITNKDETRGTCDIHSEDIVTTGSWLLRRTNAAIYYRRVTCLNITVTCQDENMIINYEPRSLFRGRIYVPGRGDVCAAMGNGGNAQLVLPLRGSCDVSFAYSISYGAHGVINRTMAYAMVMIQNNPIIQSSGDRWIRVGCSPKNEKTTQVNATVAVRDVRLGIEQSTTEYGAKPSAASAVFGKTVSPISMYVVRVLDDANAGAVSLGEPLELRIETSDKAEINAVHLVASSKLGDSSVLLLDNKGCPTGQVDFPQFTRKHIDGLQRLSARFKAFRFPTSHVVRFAIMIRFCESECPQTVCNKNSSRVVRNTNGTVYMYHLDPEVTAEVSSDIPETRRQNRRVVARGGAPPCAQIPSDEIQLELEMLVDSRDILSADTLVRADYSSNMDVAMDDNAMVCIHELLLIALALAWLAVQIMLLLGCCVLIRRYRKLAELSMFKDYQPFDNTGFDTSSTHRRVHWPDQSIDILTS